MTSVIVGATTMAQLRADIDALGVPVTPELEARIDAIHVTNANPCP